MFNKMILQGRLTADPEMRTTTNGKTVCSFTVAWSKRIGESELKCFLMCNAWGSKAEFASKYFRKGQETLVSGELTQREYTDKSGVKRYVYEVNVDDMQFCGKKEQQEPQGQTGQFTEVEVSDDDVPF